MKIIISFIALLLTCKLAKAQTEQGTLLPGGSISFQTSESGTLFSFAPSLGYFVANNFAIGTSVGVLTSENTLFYAGPFARLYFGKSLKGKPFIAASGLIVTAERETKGGYDASVGYAFFLNQSIALELAATFSHFGDEDNNVLSVGTGFRIHFNRYRRR